MANIVIATGGTGGHIFPARCLAEELSNQNHKVMILADKNYLKYVDKDDKFGFKIISCSKAKKTFLGLVTSSLKIIYGTLQSLISFWSFRPEIIVAFGGYATFGPLVAGIVTGRKIILHEQNAHLGKVNRIFSRFADAIAVSFYDTRGIDNRFEDKKVMIGNLVRKSISDIAKEDYKLPEFIIKKSGFEDADENQNFNILVIGGSGGAKIFSDVLPKVFFDLSKSLGGRLHIVQQCREELLEYTANQYKDFNINAELSGFFKDMEDKIKQAHLVIARAGSSSIFELCAAKRPMILVPFANSSDNHQKINAKRMEEMGAALVIEEMDFDPIKVYIIIQKLIIESPELLLKISDQSLLCANQNAAKDFAEIIINYCTDK